MQTAVQPYSIFEQVSLPDVARDKCGVVAVIARPNYCAAQIAAPILGNLQRRGEDSCGLVSLSTADSRFHVARFNGKASEVFTPNFNYTSSLPGQRAIGHTRYATSGGHDTANIQPMLLNTKFGNIAIAHNGNLVNGAAWKTALEKDFGVQFQSTSDTEVILHLINLAPVSTASKNPMKDAVEFALQQLPGTYSLVIMFEDRLFAACDPIGNRPLVIVETTKGLIVSSEDSAIFRMSDHEKLSVRDIGAGELVEISAAGAVSYHRFSDAKPAHCSFESFYISHYSSNIWGINLTDARRNFGRVHAIELIDQLRRGNGINFADFDVIVPIPDSAKLAAEGFYEVARKVNTEIKMMEVFAKKGPRTFLEPSAPNAHMDSFESEDFLQNGMSQRGKYNVVSPNAVKGKRVIIVDDSGVRGTTFKEIARTLEYLGAASVFIVAASPQIVDTCDKGVYIANREQLLAHRHEGDTTRMADEISQALQQDSKIPVGISFLSLATFAAIFGNSASDMCYACMGGPNPLSSDDFVSSPLGQDVPLPRLEAGFV